MKILLVDDEPLDLFIAKKHLSMDFEVNGFATSKEALEWAKDNTFDVALIDYYLGPDIGVDVLKALIELKGKSFRAYLLTNFIDPQQVLNVKSQGFDDVIFKPLSSEKVKSLVAS